MAYGLPTGTRITYGLMSLAGSTIQDAAGGATNTIRPLTHPSEQAEGGLAVDATREQWRPVVGYEGHYEVSNLGKVRSLPRPTYSGRGRPIRGGILAASLVTKRKYPTVYLYRGGKGRAHRVHRLVLETFVGPCPAGMEALHKNDVASDNRLINLRWGTKSENATDIVRNGNNRNANKTNCIRGHEFPEPAMYAQSGGRRCLPCERIRATEARAALKSDPGALARKREYQREWMRDKRAKGA